MTVTDTGITTVVDPATGEILDLASASLRDLASFLLHVREQERSLQEQKRAATARVLETLDDRVTWTVREEEFEIKAPSPSQVTYSASKLWEELNQLVLDGAIPESAAEAACERSYTYSAKPAGINRLKKLGGVAASVVAACAIPVDPDTRRVSVTRKGFIE